MDDFVIWKFPFSVPKYEIKLELCLGWKGQCICLEGGEEREGVEGGREGREGEEGDREGGEGGREGWEGGEGGEGGTE